MAAEAVFFAWFLGRMQEFAAAQPPPPPPPPPPVPQVYLNVSFQTWSVDLQTYVSVGNASGYADVVRQGVPLRLDIPSSTTWTGSVDVNTRVTIYVSALVPDVGIISALTTISMGSVDRYNVPIVLS